MVVCLGVELAEPGRKDAPASLSEGMPCTNWAHEWKLTLARNQTKLVCDQAGNKLKPSWSPARTMLECSWEATGTQPGAQLEPTWNPLGWNPAGTQLEPSWNHAGTQLEPSWIPAGTQLETARNMLEPTWKPKLSKHNY